MKQLTRLFIPICLETLFYMLSGMVDTLMLSAVGDYAVGAVGTANSYIGIFIIMFSIISSGMVSVMTQNIGAGRPGVAYQARQLGLLFNAVAGVLMAVFLFSGAGAILRMVGIADALYEPALIYLKIVGGGCILNAVIFECTYSYFFKLSARIRIYKAAIICHNRWKYRKFCDECSISFCIAQGCCRCRHSNCDLQDPEPVYCTVFFT